MAEETSLKVMPNDINAEQAVLGSLLVDSEAITNVVGILKAEDFYRADHKLIYTAMLDLYNQGKVIDILLLKEQLILQNALEKIGNMEYLMSLAEAVPTTSNLQEYVGIVEQKSILRKLINASNEISSLSYSQNKEMDFILEQAEGKIFNILQNRNTQGYSSLKDILIDTFDMIEKLYNKKSNVSGIESGFIDLDLKTSGLNPSDLVIVAARPAMGKSAFVLNIASYVSKTQSVPVMIFSLEMSKEQMVNRILCSEAEVDSNKVRTGKLEGDDWIKLGKTSGPLSSQKIYIDDTPGLTGAELRAKCRKAKLEKDIGLVIIDYLQLMQGKERSEGRQQDISDISRSLKILAKELNIPVIALSQLSRGPDSRDDHRPRLSDIRESGAIEQDADIVLFLYRDDYYNPDTEDKNIAEVIVAKNRNGTTGTVQLAWQGQYTKFKNLYRE